MTRRQTEINGLTDEIHGAQFLADTLAATYGVTGNLDTEIWARYGRYMQSRWRLTPSEMLIAVECIKGFTNLEVAETKGLSVETVNKHLDAVYAKAGVNSRMQLSAKLLKDSAYIGIALVQMG